MRETHISADIQPAASDLTHDTLIKKMFHEVQVQIKCELVLLFTVAGFLGNFLLSALSLHCQLL